MGESAARATPRPFALRVYLLVVGAAGALTLASSSVSAVHAPLPVGWLGLAALAMATSSLRLNIASVEANIAIDDTFFISTIVLFGPGPATLGIAASSCLVSWRRHMPRHQIVFNIAAPALSIWAAGQTFFALAGVAPLARETAPIGTLVLPLVSLAAVYFALNSGLTAVAVGLDTGQPAFGIWRRHFQWLSINYFAAASVAFCMILLIQQASLMAAIVVLPLLAIFHLTLRASFGRVEDAHRHLAAVDRLYLSTVQTLAMAIDAKDDVTHSHVQRVQAYATGLARAVGITDEPTLKAIQAAALLHDTGKLAVPEHILKKPGKLTAAEFEKMKLHVDIGADILSLVQFPYPVVPIVRCHHENWDGSGYPRGIKGEEIPIGARILSVVDCFDALTSDRPYRHRMAEGAAIAILRERSGRMYDPRIVETFIAVYRDISVSAQVAPEQCEVLQRITASRNGAEPPALPPASGTSNDLLTFVSLARIASGDASVLDALSLASSLVADIVPGVTGAWYLPDEKRDCLVVADAFGPSADAVVGVSIPTGERLTGWVAASRQPIVDSEAALDLDAAHGAGPTGLQRCMSVPLVLGNSLVAVLSLYSADSAELTGERARLIQVVAPHLAGTIHAAVRAEESRRVSTPIDRQSRELRLVSTR
jgi:putative nucleotidyltransferase with HDIG domain